MEGTSRLYQRKKYTVPFTYTAQEYPPVASATQPLPLSDAGLFVEKKHSATLKDCSLDGFGFEADSSISPGTEINVKMIPPMAGDLKNAELIESRAIVKWCNKKESYSKRSYEVGAKRIREENMPIMNFDKMGFGSIKVF